ncbi:MAG TPA: 2-hydroxyacid dehydrogenase [Trebonia sp.]|jgi:phosphoglycerate dehydrogenase-like enzyme|nr:2-hydroxyacid dehydrogenase [Trebonia sp.]
MTGLPDTRVEVVNPADLGGEADIPGSVADVEFYVPPFLGPAAVAEVMRLMPRLRVVQALTAGVDRLRPYVPAGVLLCNARGAHDAVTAEWVVGAIVAAQRDFPFFGREQAAGRWSYQQTAELAEKSVLIVGYGSIGAAVERRLAGFEVSVVRVARRPRPGCAAGGPGRDGGDERGGDGGKKEVHGLDALPGLLPSADVVVLTVPFTPETSGMADAGFLARMMDGALLVNAARGPVVVTDALVAEVASGRLRAAMDVTDPEPLPPGHPLWSLPGAFITPHVGASTPVSLRRAAELARRQAAAYLRGEPLQNVIAGTY